MEKEMIPKIIHYCWFGRGEKPKLAKKCIASWKRFCPDYEIVEWNEDNFDVSMNPYTQMCAREKKWAFLSDYVRLWAVEKCGGIYFDTDVELLRSPDFLWNETAFFGFEAAETENKQGFINTGHGFGSEAHSVAIREMLKEYEPLMDGKHGTIGCPSLNTDALMKLGLKLDGSLQRFTWGTVYPVDVFNPYDAATGCLNKTKNTVSVHWYMGSFLSPLQRIRSAITKPFHRLFGKNCFDFLKRKRKGSL